MGLFSLHCTHLLILTPWNLPPLLFPVPGVFLPLPHLPSPGATQGHDAALTMEPSGHLALNSQSLLEGVTHFYVIIHSGGPSVPMRKV
jgi:hypothetical protein